MQRPLVVGLVGILAIAGCAAVSPTQVGQATGSLAGGAIAPGIGMPIGALVGTLAGLVIEHQLDKAREQKERGELSQQLQAPLASHAAMHGRPPLGEPTRVWVDETIGNGRLMAGHFELRTIP